MKRALIILILILSLSNALASEELNIGDTLFFGKYEQDNILENGKEDLEWIVLDKQENKALLITKYCIDTVIFYPERVPMYWGKSDLRAWMNDAFIKETFSPDEQSRIQVTINKNENPHGMKGAGDDTADMVFLLSKAELLHYFPNQEDRVAYPTELAISKGCTLDPKTGSCRWWTRTTGARKMDVCGVRLDGRVSAYGMQDVDWPTNTMRPIMWIKIND
ncbi:MAG: hypothetical protein GYA87_00445 [Christensenellaceae bacterium]|nr:hypothetical protein [Christensenellaceae bacterium]